ncbi:MAG: D-2-hydroxyacid dehydrogenase [Firmicutes bacterium]|nr:D-2-hydroxyacid dehydrogenase [Bacillota bacterium]
MTRVLLGLAPGPGGTLSLLPGHVEALRQQFPSTQVQFVWAQDREQYEAELPRAEVLFTRTIRPEDLRRAPHLCWVHSLFAGVDQSITPELRQSGVLLTRSAGTAATGIAEHVLGALIFFSRGFHLALQFQRRSQWGQAEIGPHLRELAGSTLVIVGFGNIGTAVAQRARALGMRVLAVRRQAAPQPAAAPPEAGVPPETHAMAERVFGADQLYRALAEGDYVVSILPLTAETRHFLDERAFSAMKKGAVFVNVGRGPTVDEQALVRALQEGHLYGAALDVFEQEPLPADSPLYQMPNVLVTPHVAGINPRYMDRAVASFAENLRRFLQGEPLLHLVNKEMGY